MRLAMGILLLSGSVVLAADVPSPTPTAAQLEFFETRIRPVLAETCYKCHSARAQKLKAGLRVDSRAGLIKGGDSGTALLPGVPARSRLFVALSYVDSDLAMPPKQKLPASVIADFQTWIKDGAVWPAEAVAARADRQEWDWDKLRAEHWAWQAVRTPPLPQVSNQAWPRTPIDHFVLARLEARSLAPSPPAAQRVLIRRAWLDMLGLPPSPAQVEAFVSGQTTWEEVIEILLKSPHYGERWGRHWLDVARYSDGLGGFADKENIHAWRYRDWVIESMNADLPINTFLQLQIAGDLVNEQKFAVATGFFSLGPEYKADAGFPQSIATSKIETLDDRVDTLGRGMLGITMACARCHDHKFDPVPTLDYYSIAGVFNNTGLSDTPIAPQAEIDSYQAQQEALQEKERVLHRAKDEVLDSNRHEVIGNLSKYILAADAYAKLDEKDRTKPDIFARQRGLLGCMFHHVYEIFSPPVNARKVPEFEAWYASRTSAGAKAAEAAAQKTLADAFQADGTRNPAKYQPWDEIRRHLKPLGDIKLDMKPDVLAAIERLEAEVAAMKEAMPSIAVVQALTEIGETNMKVALRGNLLKPGPEAPRRFLRILGGEATPSFTRGSGRSELAAAVVAADNPLTARVFVNRVWGWHFGAGLVRTPSNFGALGMKPSHPGLLDWLATDFCQKGWSLKKLHRLILSSATYQQSSRFDAEKFATDSDNRLLWRMQPRKLEVEAWRDSLLAVSGELDTTAGGEPFEDLQVSMRRTVYAKTSRNGDKFKTDVFLRLFDFPPPRASVARRVATITPQQSLFLLNNAFIVDRAKALASRLAQGASSLDGQVKLGYAWLLCREPTTAELAAGRAYLAGTDPKTGSAKLSRLERYAQALLLTNEFFFVE